MEPPRELIKQISEAPLRVSRVKSKNLSKKCLDSGHVTGLGEPVLRRNIGDLDQDIGKGVRGEGTHLRNT
jgi:hypothetical protein